MYAPILKYLLLSTSKETRAGGILQGVENMGIIWFHHFLAVFGEGTEQSQRQ